MNRLALIFGQANYHAFGTVKSGNAVTAGHCVTGLLVGVKNLRLKTIKTEIMNISTLDYINFSDKEYVEAGTDNYPKSVYLLKAFHPGYNDPIYKIGISNDPPQRVYEGWGPTRSLASEYPFPLLIVAVYKPYRMFAHYIEKDLHTLFDSHRINIGGPGGSEWFKQSFSDERDSDVGIDMFFLTLCSERDDDNPLNIRKVDYYDRYILPTKSYEQWMNESAKCLWEERSSMIALHKFFSTSSAWEEKRERIEQRYKDYYSYETI